MKRFALISLALSTLTGCGALMHELQPHRLWRMNYYDSPGRSEQAFMSISDPLDKPVEKSGQTPAADAAFSDAATPQ